MTVAGKKLHVPREMARQVASYLFNDWRPRAAGPRLPGGDGADTDARAASQVDRARRIAVDIAKQVVDRRCFAERPILIVLSKSDTEWLSENLPRYRVLAPPPAWAVGMFGFLCKANLGRRGRRVIWASEVLSNKALENRSDRQQRRYQRRLMPTEDN